MVSGVVVNDDLVLTIAGQTYVQSRSDRTRFYAATESSCECPAAQYRPTQMCRHQRTISEYNRARRTLLLLFARRQ